MKINALCLNNASAVKSHCDKVVYCGEDAFVGDGIIAEYKPFGANSSGDVYIPTLCDEDLLEQACDYLITAKARAIVRASYDLNEAGIIEARHKLSPIMLLHKMGVLGNCTVAGGVCLDNDDLDLMAQEGVALILTPTASAGYGHGFAPVCAAVKRGIKIGIGTFDGKYNKNHDINYELEFLRVTANAEMRVENAISDADLNKMLNFE